MSTIRMITLSQRPPRYAATSPTTSPSDTAINVEITPTLKLMRSPYKIADHRSRPCSSLPIKNVWPSPPVLPGGKRASIMSSCAKSYGFCIDNHGAPTAASTINTNSAKPNSAVRLAAYSASFSRQMDGSCISALPNRRGAPADQALNTQYRPAD